MTHGLLKNIVSELVRHIGKAKPRWLRVSSVRPPAYLSDVTEDQEETLARSCVVRRVRMSQLHRRHMAGGEGR